MLDVYASINAWHTTSEAKELVRDRFDDRGRLDAYFDIFGIAMRGIVADAPTEGAIRLASWEWERAQRVRGRTPYVEHGRVAELLCAALPNRADMVQSILLSRAKLEGRAEEKPPWLPL